MDWHSAWTEQQFRWQVAKNAEITEQIAAQERTLDQLNRGSRGITLTDRTLRGTASYCFPAMPMCPRFGV